MNQLSEGVTTMKTAAAKIFTIAFLFAFLLIVLPVSVSAAGEDSVNHVTLSQQYKQQAEEYKAKIAEEIQAVKSRPRTASFGRNAQTFKQHVSFKLHQFEDAVKENLQKAAYHEQMAAKQATQPIAVKDQASKVKG